MKTLTVRLIIAIIIASLIFSCKAYRNVENLKPKIPKESKEGPFEKSSLSKLVPGDKIKITTISGFTYHMTYMNWAEDYVRGTVQKVNSTKVLIGEEKKIPINEIEALYVKRKSAGATTPVLLVVGAAVFFLGLLIALAGSDFV